VDCPVAISLLEKLAVATNDYFGATDTLANLVGQHREFAEEKAYAESMREKCSTARSALEQHYSEHGCRRTSRTRC
jgi:hypothetical protein